MQRSLVSILIPCHNAEKFVGEAIESALGQTYANLEVIVVDDGSTDASLHVIRSFGKHIRWETGPNRGACSARNRALHLSAGEFVQFLDADDLLLPLKVASQIPLLVEDKADLVLSTGLRLDDESGVLTPLRCLLPSPSGYDPFAYCLAFATQGLTTEGPLHRRACLERVGGFRPHVRRFQDCDLHIRLGAIGVRLGMVEPPIFHHRHHSGPRITSSTNTVPYLEILLELCDVLASPPYLMSAGRKGALAIELFEHSRRAFRNDEIRLAQRGFAAASALDSRFASQSRLRYRALVRLLGPMNAERIRTLVRAVK